MIRKLLYIILLITVSCEDHRKSETDASVKTGKYSIVATTPDGKEIKQVISEKQMKTLVEGLTNKRENDTLYNALGKPKTVIHKMMLQTVYEYFKYNKKGQLISQYGRTSDSIPIPIYNEVAYINYQYQNDLLKEIRKYNVANNLISSEWEDTPIIQLKYDDKMNLIEKWYLNQDEELRGEFSILRYHKNGNDYGWYNLKGAKQKDK